MCCLRGRFGIADAKEAEFRRAKPSVCDAVFHPVEIRGTIRHAYFTKVPFCKTRIGKRPDLGVRLRIVEERLVWYFARWEVWLV